MLTDEELEWESLEKSKDAGKDTTDIPSFNDAKDLGFGLLTPGAITSDGAISGNIWVGCDSQTTPVLRYIGLATPVTTPLLPGKP